METQVGIGIGAAVHAGRIHLAIGALDALPAFFGDEQVFEIAQMLFNSLAHIKCFGATGAAGEFIEAFFQCSRQADR